MRGLGSLHFVTVCSAYIYVYMYVHRYTVHIYIYALGQMLYLVSDTVFKAVVWRNCTKTSQIVMQRAPCEGRTDVCGVECLNWIIFHSWLFKTDETTLYLRVCGCSESLLVFWLCCPVITQKRVGFFCKSMKCK